MAPPRKLIAKNKEKEQQLIKCQYCSKLLSGMQSYKVHEKLHTSEYQYSCELCSYKCKIKKYLSRHVKKAHGKANGPRCTVCGKAFHFDSNLKNHMRVHTGEKPYKCTVCGKAFSSTYCLSMHKLIHTNEKPFECSFCDYACRDSSTLRRHQERHMGIYKTYPCKKCKKVFKKNTTLKIHIDEVHYGLDTRTFPCDRCEKAFKTKPSLRSHIKTMHEGKTERVGCDICGRNVTKNNVINHLKTHIDIRPYKCSFKQCGKQFKDQGSLKKHTLIHYPEHQYQCDICDCRFPRRNRLKEHRQRHVDIGGYVCDYCGVSFTSKAYIQMHIRKKHVNCERFICDECKSVSYSKRSMVLHLKFGHGSKYDKNCKICKAELGDCHLLAEHYLKRHNVRYVIRTQPEDRIVIKDEPIEVLAEFDFDYDVQKIEIDEYIPDPEYVDTESTLAYSETVLAEDISRSMDKDGKQHPESAFDEFYMEHVVDKPGVKEHIPDPESVETETTLSYSKRVLEEDITRSIQERDRAQPTNAFDDFFVQVMKKSPKKKSLPKQIVNKRQLVVMKNTLKRMLCESKQKKELDILETMRREYNERIHTATRSNDRRERTQIKYYNISTSELTKNQDNNISQNVYDDQESSLSDDQPSPMDIQNDLEADKSCQENDKSCQEKHKSCPENGIPRQENEVSCQENEMMSLVNEVPCQENNTASQEDGVPSQLNEIPSQENEESYQANSINVQNNYEASNSNQLYQKNHDGQDIIESDQEIDYSCQEYEKLQQINGETYQDNVSSEDNGIPCQESAKYCQESDKYCQESDKSCQVNDKSSQDNARQENGNSNLVNDNLSQLNYDINQENNSSQEYDEKEDERIYDVPLAQRRKRRISKAFNSHGDEENSSLENDDSSQKNDEIEDEIIYDRPIAQRRKRRLRKAVDCRDEEENNVSQDGECGEANKNGKLTFMGHECYICFKIFQTKNDLKDHCREHFDICNEKMLKKCPFCGFVTNRNIKRHIWLVHKVNIRYAYGNIMEKAKQNGSKYVFEIDKDCELEVIPSISNLNKMACMKIDEKNRKSKNVLMGKTKLVKKGGNWIIEKEAIPVSTEYLLPEFTDEEYRKLKIEGDSYLDRIKKLSCLAKMRGLKMLYPCSGCEKICQSMAALILHNRRHESNPKRYKPKVWVNRHIEYKTKNRKKIRCSNKTRAKEKEKMAAKRTAPRRVERREPVTVLQTEVTDGRKKQPVYNIENRLAAPQPVKNKHKCDKQLIEFYNSNIKGKDIEFWQFLKIFNKMTRENVNDFKDLENRGDVHFGVHVKENTETDINHEPVTTEKLPVVTENLPDFTENEPVLPKNNGLKKIVKKKFTRAIMISKKEYLRRNEMKKEMRKRLEESRT